MDAAVYAIYCVVATLIRLLPVALVFRMGAALGAAAYYLAVPYRNLVLRNLAIAFREEKSAAERRGIARKHFANLGANFLSSLKLARASCEELERRVSFEGMEMINGATAGSRGFVAVVSHIGNWELFAPLSTRLFARKGATIYQRLGNRYLDAEMRRSRARLGLGLFERKEGFIAAGKFIRQGGVCGVLIDQHAGDAGLWVPFFNRLASTSTLAATLALRTGTAVLPLAIYTAGVARWRVTILPPIPAEGHDTETLTMRINKVLERQIRHQPEDWFWVHNRWKTPKPKFLLATYKRGVALPRHTVPGTLQPFRILIRSSNWLGDAVMSAPAVRAIKRGRPDAQVTILTPAKLGDFWRTMAEVDEVISIQREQTVFHVASQLRERRFEAAVLFPNSLRAAIEAWLAGIPRRVGEAGHFRKALLNQVPREKRRKRAEPPPHQAERYLALATFSGARRQDAFDRLAMDSPAEPRALILGLCPGAEYGPAKRWLPDRFAEVMSTLSTRRVVQWKLFGVENDREVAAEILTRAPGVPCNDMVGKTTLGQLIDELRSCRLLVTNDTGTMHLAAHLGVPTVAIFGSTEPALTGPLGGRHRVLRHHVECSPCFLRECPIDFRCMKAVQTSEVVAAIEELLDELGTNARGAEFLNKTQHAES